MQNSTKENNTFKLAGPENLLVFLAFFVLLFSHSLHSTWMRVPPNSATKTQPLAVSRP